MSLDRWIHTHHSAASRSRAFGGAEVDAFGGDGCDDEALVGVVTSLAGAEGPESATAHLALDVVAEGGTELVDGDTQQYACDRWSRAGVRSVSCVLQWDVEGESGFAVGGGQGACGGDGVDPVGHRFHLKHDLT